MDVRLFNKCLENIHKREYFDQLYNFFYKRIVLHIARNFGDSVLCDDVAQECFITLLSLKDIKYIEYYSSWIYKIADNIALRKYGKELKEKDKCLYMDVISFDKYNIEPFGMYQSVINEENETCKSLMYLYYVEGYPLFEIAEILEITYTNAKQIHSRCLKKLKAAAKAEKNKK